MTKRASRWLDERLDAAEREGRCLVPGAGCDVRRLRRAVEAGQLVEVQPRVFARPSWWADLKPRDRLMHRMRTLYALHPDIVFCGTSAAAAHGLAVSNRYLDQVWIARPRTARIRSSETWQVMAVSNDRHEMAAGLPVTSLARTVGDCIRTMDFRSGLAVADGALHRAACGPAELEAAVREACAQIPGLSRMRATLALADGRSESGGESIARATMLELGLMPPDLQRSFTDPLDPSRWYRVDFAWDVPGGCIVGELDGFEKYVAAEMRGDRTLAQTIEAEHRRQSALEALPEVLRFVRFGFADVRDDVGFLRLLAVCGVPRSYAMDAQVIAAGGTLRCR